MTPCCGGEIDHEGFGFERLPTPDRPFAINRGRTRMLVLHPTTDGTPGLHALAIHLAGLEGRESPSWSWDGNDGAPTLYPSIKCSITGWHGYLNAGRMEHV